MASSSSSSTSSRRIPGKGRRRIEMKRVEDSSKRLVTFSKRKEGIFRKASQLSLLCDSQIAVIIFSQHGKVFTSGYPDTDAVIGRYLSGQSASSSSESEAAESSMVRREYEEAMKALEKEKEVMDNGVAGIPSSGSIMWWDRPVGEMGLEEAMEFKQRIELLRQNVVAAAEKKKETETAVTVASSSPVTLPAPTEEEEGLYMALMNAAHDVAVVDNDPTLDLDFWNLNDGTDGFDLSHFL